MTDNAVLQTRKYVLYYGLSLFVLIGFIGFFYIDAQKRSWISLIPAEVGFRYIGYSSEKNDTNLTTETVKYVLYWNVPLSGGLEMFNDCDYKCELTTDKSKMASQNAVIFHTPYLGGNVPAKSRGQVWVYYGVEPPPISHNLKRWQRVFNWTINYRRDSDILSRYGSFESKHLNSRNRTATDIGELSIRKNMTAAWFVGNCNTHGRRETYVKVLQKHMDVSIYGRCGNLRCKEKGRAANWGENCLHNVEKDTRYYLSFENSLCRDYMTEKAFKVFKTHSLVPVVRGGANYSMYLSPDTFIDSSRFKDATDLSKYLVKMKTDKTAFTRLFENRNRYQTKYNDNWGSKPFCEICRRLHNPEKYRRIYEDVSVWVRGTGDTASCRKPTDLT
ncbi:alpha-(1,3)-fucosyltransferase C-like [Ylistrum balloti]|uniref:alpha-(1,3)-fucosyltransferase C-like n=1 Tax=Ylistrum balloti TaxID=509963 RepID=UPI002905C01A|nr:alpha-(1,3)-fucosyltransferase C-like [Ylistrum balloti]XP_060085221.1 alpha-(1,3)-fucosyltransferase C-like [Ylistrum balloti]